MSQAGAGLLYLLSCLAKFGDMRAEMEAAGAVDILLELLSTCHDTKVQVKLLSSNHALLLHEEAVSSICHGKAALQVSASCCVCRESTGCVMPWVQQAMLLLLLTPDRGRQLAVDQRIGPCWAAAAEVCENMLTMRLLHVQAATLSLLRILTRAGRTLCATQEHGSHESDPSSIVPGRASLGSRGAGGSDKRRSLDGPPTPREALSACQALAASGRSQSLCLF